MMCHTTHERNHRKGHQLSTLIKCSIPIFSRIVDKMNIRYPYVTIITFLIKDLISKIPKNTVSPAVRPQGIVCIAVIMIRRVRTSISAYYDLSLRELCQEDQ